MIGFPGTRVALDLGTANTIIYVKGRGVVLAEPSVVTVRASNGAIEAAGAEARAGLGRTPQKFRVERPIRTGTISDLTLCKAMLQRFLAKARVVGSLSRGLRVAMSAPGGLTEVERLATVESLRDAGARSVVLVDQVLAAARGAGLQIEECRGRMVVDIGAGVTDIAVISLGNTVHSRTIKVAGEDLDAAIVDFVRGAHQLLMGERTAERLKIEIGSALPDGDVRMRIRGRCLAEGIPREVEIHGREVCEAIAPPLERIVHAIGETLEQAPPELSADLIESGILLTGGSALLRGLDERLCRKFGIPVRVAPDPLGCVIQGLAWQLKRLRRSDWRRFGKA